MWGILILVDYYEHEIEILGYVPATRADNNFVAEKSQWIAARDGTKFDWFGEFKGSLFNE